MRGLRQLAALLEAFLFVKGDPVTMEEMVGALCEDPDEIAKALALLTEKYNQEDTGIMLHKTGAGWSLTTKKEYDAWLTETLGKQTPLSSAALETLAVIAMKEPVTRAEIEKIRGVSAGRILATLLEKELVEERGRLEVPGRPILYGTTRQFLKCTGLSNVSELKMKWAHAPDEGDLF